MVRERIKEIVDFVSSESPYSSANKGWINEDIYIQWGKSTKQNNNSANEVLNISFFWNPIQILLSILFGVLLISTIFVFSVISFSNGRFNISQLLVLNAPETIDKVQELVVLSNQESEKIIKLETKEEIEVLTDIDNASENLDPISEAESNPLNTFPKKEVETANMLQPRK